MRLTWMLWLPFLVFAENQSSMGIIKLFKGEVWVMRGGQKISAEKDLPLFNGDRVQSGKNSKAQIVVEENKILFLSENSEITIRKDPNSKEKETGLDIGIMYGKMRAIVGGKKSSQYKVKVFTGTTVAGVRGTHFEVIRPKGKNSSSILNLNSDADSMEILSTDQAKNSKPLPIPPGSLTIQSKDKPALLPTRLAANQLNFFSQADSDGEALNSVFDETGKATEPQLNFPPSVDQYKEPQLPSFLPNQQLVPPKGYKLARIKGQLTFVPFEETSIAADTNSGDFIPIVKFGTNQAEGWVLHQLLNNSSYRKKLGQNFNIKQKSTLLKIQMILAKNKKNEIEVTNLRPQLTNTEIAELKNKIEMEKMRLSLQKDYHKNYLDNLFFEAEQAKNTKEINRLRLEKEVLKNQIQLTGEQISFFENQIQLKLRLEDRGYKKYSSVGLLASERNSPIVAAKESELLKNENEILEIKNQMGNLANSIENSKASLNALQNQQLQDSLKVTGQAFNQFMDKKEDKGNFMFENPLTSEVKIVKDIPLSSLTETTKDSDTKIKTLETNPSKVPDLSSISSGNQDFTKLAENIAGELVQKEALKDSSPRDNNSRSTASEVAMTQKPEEMLKNLCAQGGCDFLKDGTPSVEDFLSKNNAPTQNVAQDCPPGMCSKQLSNAGEGNICAKDPTACLSEKTPKEVVGGPCILDPSRPECGGGQSVCQIDPCAPGCGSCKINGSEFKTVQVRVTCDGC